MIGIVGGGIAGLAAGYRLTQAGYTVHIFDAADTVGGLAATYDTRGDRIEQFYHHLSRTEDTIVDLATDLGLADHIEWHIGHNAYYVDGIAHPLDAPWEIAAYPHLSLYDKFRLTMLTLGIDVRHAWPRRDTYDALEDFEHIPVEDFVIEHATQSVYDNFFDPLLDAKFGDRKDDVSAAWLLGRIQFRGERDLLRGEILGYLNGGFGILIDALIDAIGRDAITTNAPVTRLTFTDTPTPPTPETTSPPTTDSEPPPTQSSPGTPIETPEGSVSSLTVTPSSAAESETQTYAVDSVVVATMPDVLQELTGYTCDIEFQGSVVAVVSMDEPLLDTYWLNIADDAPFGALIEHTNFIPPERYGGEHLLYIARYVQDPTDPIWQRPDDTIQSRWLTGIEELFPQFNPETINWMRIARNTKTAPIYERGYLNHVIPYDLRDAVAPGVYYAGMATRAQYPERSLNGAIEAGFAAADAIQTHPGS